MKTRNIFAKSAILAIAALSLTACSESHLDEINKDLNHSTDATANFIIPELELHTAQNIVGGDFNTYFGSYVEHWVGTHNQLYNAEIRGNQIHAASTYNNIWAGVYENIRNGKIVVEKCSIEGSEPTNTLTKAVGEIMLAYNAAVATDVFGDTPYAQVGDYKNFLNPDLDTQKNIYDEIFKLLDDAIELLEDGPSNTLGSYDFIYGGNSSLWIKFAYGLKARYTMRLILRSENKTQDLQNVITYADKSFKSAAEQAKINVYDANNINPLFDFEWSRDGISSSESLHDKLMERNDPRVNHVYVHSSTWEAYDGETVVEYLAPNGNPIQSQYEYAYDAFFFAQTADVHLLSYHEVLFLKAEAQARLGQDPIGTLKDAVKAAMVNFNNNVTAGVVAPAVCDYGGIEDPGLVSDGEIEAYLSEVEAACIENAIKEVMMQKYFAFWGANGESTECYNDVRRLKAMGEDIYDFQNKGKFPLRAGYGTDDTSSNPYVKKAFGDGMYVYTENVWWAGGNR